MEKHSNEKKPLTWLQEAALQILRQGEIPRHISFIMDGNRRFARSKGLDCTYGHKQGYEKLLELVEWCLAANVKICSAYALSIENFKRSPRELEVLLDLIRTSFREILLNINYYQGRGVRFLVLGKMDLLPADIQKLIGQVMRETTTCSTFTLVLLIAYTGRYDIIQAMQELKEGLSLGLIESSDISEDLLQRTLLTGDLPPVDVLVRTSGEMRLSDYMLWQTSYSYMCFSKLMWPVYSFWAFVGVLLKYQLHKHYSKYQPSTCTGQEDMKEKEAESSVVRIHSFLKNLAKKRSELVNMLARGQCHGAM